MSSVVAPASMHIRLKRSKTTIFLLVEPSDAFAKIRTKVSEIVGVEADKVRIIGKDKETAFPDAALLSDHDIEDDDVLYFVLQNDGGAWEGVDVVDVKEYKEEEEEVGGGGEEEVDGGG